MFRSTSGRACRKRLSRWTNSLACNSVSGLPVSAQISNSSRASTTLPRPASGRWFCATGQWKYVGSVLQGTPETHWVAGAEWCSTPGNRHQTHFPRYPPGWKGCCRPRCSSNHRISGLSPQWPVPTAGSIDQECFDPPKYHLQVILFYCKGFHLYRRKKERNLAQLRKISIIQIN